MKVKRISSTVIEIQDGNKQCTCRCTNQVFYPFATKGDCKLAVELLKDVGVEIEVE